MKNRFGSRRIASMVLCIVILFDFGACTLKSNRYDLKQPSEVPESAQSLTQAPEEVPEPSVAATSEPTSAPEPTGEPVATDIPGPTEAVTPTKAPTSTPAPTEAVTPTKAPTSTLAPTEVITPTKAPTSTPAPTEAITPTKAPTSTPAPTEAITPTKAPTSTPKPTKAPTPTPVQDSYDTGCTYSYSDKFSVKRDGVLSEDSYLSRESDVYYFILESVFGRANRYYLTFGAANADIVQSAAKQIANLPGMLSISVEKKEYWSNGAAFYVEVQHVSEFSTLAAWKSDDKSRLSNEGKQLLNKAKEIVAKAQAYDSDYDKVKFFHDYLVLNTIYDVCEGDTVGQTAYGALVEGRCVCMGYTNAFHLLLTMSGIDCLIVSGEAGGESHAWNKVRIDNEWYNVDVTWDDPVPDRAGVVGYAYFNVTDSQLAKDHFWDNSGLPTASSTRLNYYLQTLPVLGTTEEIIKFCKECRAAGESKAEFIAGGEVPEFQVLVQELQCGISYQMTDCQSGVVYQIIFN